MPDEIKKVTFEPLLDRVIVELDKPDEKTPGGIIKPDAKLKDLRGTVLAIGPGLPDLPSGRVHPMTVKVGDRVFIGKTLGTLIDHDGKEGCLIIREVEILAIEKR